MKRKREWDFYDDDDVNDENAWDKFLVPDTQRMILGFLSPLERLFMAWTSWDNYKFCRVNYIRCSFLHLLMAYGTNELCIHFEEDLIGKWTMKKEYDESLLITAISHGNMDTMECYRFHHHRHFDNLNVYKAALRSGWPYIVRRLNEQTLKNYFDKDSRLIDALFAGGYDLEFIKHVFHGSEPNSQRMLRAALAAGRIDVAEYLYTLNASPDTFDLLRAFHCKQLVSVKFMHKIAPLMFSQNMFCIAIDKGAPDDILDWMWENTGPFDLLDIEYPQCEWLLRKKKELLK